MQATKIYNLWKNYPLLDSELKEELLTLSEDEIVERFTYPLEFGTGGLRDKMGVGISRLNIYTISQAAKGFSLYLKKTFKQGKVVISYDNRMHSKRFAFESAKVLIHDGFDVYVFESLRPTPMLSYAVRHFQAVGGIMITASHNPKEDNGFKAYNHTGAQINLEEAQSVIQEIKGINDIFSIEKADVSNIQFIDASFDDIYLDVGTLRLREKGGHGGQNGLKNIITHLHSQEFKRVRFGIGENKNIPLDQYVLSNFNKSEEKLVEEVTIACLEIIEAFIQNVPFVDIMTKHNTKK